MRFLKRFAKWSLVAGTSVVVMVAMLWFAARIIYPTESQRQASAELANWPAYEGKNAYALLWTLNHEVPDDALEAVMVEDVREFSPTPASPPEKVSGSIVSSSGDLPSAARAYPDLVPSEADRALFCGQLKPDCLSRVADDFATYEALVERNRALLARVDRLQDYSYIRSEFPYSIWSPWPNYSAAYYTRTRNAVQFAGGEHQAAIALTCRDILTWRRLGSRSDSLVFRMAGDALSSRESGRLLAEMLAQYPVDRALPEPCAEALAPPVGEELSLCNALRGEYGMNANAIALPLVDPDQPRLDRITTHAFIDPEASLGMMAEGYLALCKNPDGSAAKAQHEALLRDRVHVRRLECVSNLHACVLHALAFPTLSDYQDRVIDHGARLRLLGTLAWMRGQLASGRSPEVLLTERPDALNDESDQLSFGPDGKTLQIAMRWTRRGETWSVPLPPKLFVPPG